MPDLSQDPNYIQYLTNYNGRPLYYNAKNFRYPYSPCLPTTMEFWDKGRLFTIPVRNEDIQEIMVVVGQNLHSSYEWEELATKSGSFIWISKTTNALFLTEKHFVDDYKSTPNTCAWGEVATIRFDQIQPLHDLCWKGILTDGSHIPNGTITTAVTGTVISDSMKDLPVPRKVFSQEEWKTQGLCLKCGDKGEWRNLACVCRNGHGVIFG